MILGASELQAMVNTIWTTTLDVDPVVLGTVPPLEGIGTAAVCASRVFLTGAWRGCVDVACESPLATALAATMFHTSPDAIGPAETLDAIGELTNILAGNIKSLLPSPTYISLPVALADGDDPFEGAEASWEGFQCPGGNFTVRLCPERHPRVGPSSVFPTEPTSDDRS